MWYRKKMWDAANESSRLFAAVALVSLALLGPPTACSAVQDSGAEPAPAGAHDDTRESGTQAEPPATLSTPEPGRAVTLSFHDVSVGVLAQFFQALTGKRYVVEGSQGDRLDLNVERRLSVGEAETIFVSTMESRGYRVVSEAGTVRVIVPPIRAVRVEGTVTGVPTEPLTVGEDETFDALCSDAGSWIRIRAPERRCGVSWVYQSGLWFSYAPSNRRMLRRIADGDGEQLGLPVSVRELFDVVCQTGEVPPERARFITVDRRVATEVDRDDVLIGGLIASVDKLGCADQAGRTQTGGPESR